MRLVSLHIEIDLDDPAPGLENARGQGIPWKVLSNLTGFGRTKLREIYIDQQSPSNIAREQICSGQTQNRSLSVARHLIGASRTRAMRRPPGAETDGKNADGGDLDGGRHAKFPGR